MEILVFSDSHGMVSNMKAVIQSYPRIEYVVHLGDYGTDVAEIAAANPTYIFDAVQGNCDKKKAYPLEKVLQLVGKKLLITHGHNYGVKYSLSSIIARGLRDKINIILFGHTHEPFVENIDGILLVNPGSISKSRGISKATYAVLEISSLGVQANIHRV